MEDAIRKDEQMLGLKQEMVELQQANEKLQ